MMVILIKFEGMIKAKNKTFLFCIKHLEDCKRVSSSNQQVNQNEVNFFKKIYI